SATATDYYADKAIWLSDNTAALSNLIIRDANNAVYYGSGSGSPQYLTHTRMVNCANGVFCESGGFIAGNILMSDVSTNFTTTAGSVTGSVEHLTTDGADKLNGSTNLALELVNSAIVDVTDTNSFTGTGNYASSTATN